MPTLSLCMIVKNEETNLPLCLKSIQESVNEIIIVDTGSTDSTKNIAISFGAKIYDYSWTNDFSAARNFALEKATGDYILILDPDEYIEKEDLNKIPDILSSGKKFVQINVQNYQDGMVLPSIRIFQNIGIRYKRMIHEQLDLGNDVTKEDFHFSNLKIYHQKRDQIDQLQKNDRNLELCIEQLKIDPNDADILYWTAFEYKQIGNIDNAINYYQMAVDSDKGRLIPQAARELVLLLEKEGDLKRFTKVLDEIIKLYPEFYDLLLIKAKVKLKNSEIEEAINLFLKCIESPHSEGWLAINLESAWQGLGTAYYYNNQTELALRSISSALVINEKNPESLTVLLSILIDQQGLQGAISQIPSYVSVDNEVMKELLQKVNKEYQGDSA